MELENFGDISVVSTQNAIGKTVSLLLMDSGLDEGPRDPDAMLVKTTMGAADWSPWGADNLLPLEIANDIENCGIVDATLELKSKLAVGKGIQPFLLMNISSDGKEDLEWVSDAEILDWLENNNNYEFGVDSIYDKLGYGWNTGSLVTNLAQNRIERLKRHDVFNARLEKMDPDTLLIKNLYLAGDWRGASSYDQSKQKRIPVLEEGNEFADLQARIKASNNTIEFAFISRRIRNGRHYYPQPTYRSNRIWIKIARSVPALKIALFKHSITLKYKVTFHKKFWEDKAGQLDWAKYTVEQRQGVKDEYYDKITKWLVGEDNAYKTLFTDSFSDDNGNTIDYVKVEVIDDKIADGKFLPDSGAAINEILFSLMFNPSTIGAGNPGGNAYGDTSGGSNVREGLLMQLMIMEAERKANAGPLSIVKFFNGWNTKLEKERSFMPTAGAGQPTPQSRTITPRLVWRYPSGLLTTLDTGKSTKPENL